MLAQAACSRGLHGWERLLQSPDAVERAVLRRVLAGAVVAHQERHDAFMEQLEVRIQRGVASGSPQ